MKKIIKMFAFVLGCSTCTQAVTAQVRDSQNASIARSLTADDQNDSSDALSSITDLNKIYSL